MVKQIFTLIENKVPPSCGAAILFHCTIHYTILLTRCRQIDLGIQGGSAVHTLAQTLCASAIITLCFEIVHVFSNV